jgi:hypothetical protein
MSESTDKKVSSRPVSERAKEIETKLEKLKSSSFQEGDGKTTQFFKTYKYVIIAAVGIFMVAAMGFYYAAPSFLKSKDEEGNEKISLGKVLGLSFVAGGLAGGAAYYFVTKKSTA